MEIIQIGSFGPRRIKNASVSATYSEWSPTSAEASINCEMHCCKQRSDTSNCRHGVPSKKKWSLKFNVISRPEFSGEAELKHPLYVIMQSALIPCSTFVTALWKTEQLAWLMCRTQSKRFYVFCFRTIPFHQTSATIRWRISWGLDFRCKLGILLFFDGRMRLCAAGWNGSRTFCKADNDAHKIGRRTVGIRSN